MALQYDDIATNHMLYILYPLVGGYAVYSLMYDRHRSWYSWVLSSLTGFVYTFGFIQVRWPHVFGCCCWRATAATSLDDCHPLRLPHDCGAWRVALCRWYPSCTSTTA